MLTPTEDLTSGYLLKSLLVSDTLSTRVESPTLPRTNAPNILILDPKAINAASVVLESPRPVTVKKRLEVDEEEVVNTPPDKGEHRIGWQEIKQKCLVCYSKTHTICSKCKIYLCFNDQRKCWAFYHDFPVVRKTNK